MTIWGWFSTVCASSSVSSPYSKFSTRATRVFSQLLDYSHFGGQLPCFVQLIWVLANNDSVLSLSFAVIATSINSVIKMMYKAVIICDARKSLCMIGNYADYYSTNTQTVSINFLCCWGQHNGFRTSWLHDWYHCALFDGSSVDCIRPRSPQLWTPRRVHRAQRMALTLIRSFLIERSRLIGIAVCETQSINSAE